METNLKQDGRYSCKPAGHHRRGALAMQTEFTRSVIEDVVCSTLAVTCADLHARTRKGAPIAFARQVAMYLAHVGCGMSLKESAAMFNRERTTAAHACCIIEDRRDDPAFDGFMDQLEGAVVCLRSSPAGYGRR